MTDPIVDIFFKKLKDHTLKEHDRIAFRRWLLTAPEQEVDEVLEAYGHYFKGLPDFPLPAEHSLGERMERRLDELQHDAVRETDPRRIGRPFWLSWSAAAAIVCLFVAYAVWKIPHKPDKNNQTHLVQSLPVVVTSNRIVLTLADGSSVPLDTLAKGFITDQGGSRIYKAADGTLRYEHQSVGKNKMSSGLHTIAIPHGRQYAVTLPDGTKVWLNAASTLTYSPTLNQGERRVMLRGEAYFEVAKDAARPFVVSTTNTEVEVLGTHFNVMAYPEEGKTKTTLLEGAVRIHKENQIKDIKPGEQAVVQNNISVTPVNVEKVMGWKNGNFVFAHQDLRSIMREISRWYNVEIEYKGKPTATFVGTVPRSDKLESVLKYLEMTGLVHFKMTERRVTVMP